MGRECAKRKEEIAQYGGAVTPMIYTLSAPKHIHTQRAINLKTLETRPKRTVFIKMCGISLRAD